jgi:chemotaxis protein MotB
LAEVDRKIGVEEEITKPQKDVSEKALKSNPTTQISNLGKSTTDLSVSNLLKPSSTGSDQSEVEAKDNPSEAGKLATEIESEFNSEIAIKGLPHIEVKSTSEGILISLTDNANFSMFAIGSAEPRAKTVEVIAKIAELLKSRPGFLVIRGYTDGRPYKSPVYDNWRLSSARAHMAQYMLIRGGMEEKRIEKVEGYADRHLKNPANPEATENRRIEILLRKEKP